jgi:hypothetical protein
LQLCRSGTFEDGFPPVPADHLVGPRQGIYRPNARARSLHPKLKVLEPVVIAHPVEVVNGFVGMKSAMKHSLHDEMVLTPILHPVIHQAVTILVIPGRSASISMTRL